MTIMASFTISVKALEPNLIEALINPTRPPIQAVKIEKPKLDKPKLKTYKVRPGDTLYKIAKRYKISVKRLWARNRGLKHQDKLDVGQQLKIPREGDKLKPRAYIKSTPVVNIAPVQTSSVEPQNTPRAISGKCGDNEYARFIYEHESGCNLNAINAGGCRGIGQACPGDKLPCGADYACQNAFFTEYANQRYGGWQGAYNAWLAQGWW